MKKLLLSIALVASAAAVTTTNAQAQTQAATPASSAEIKFEEETFDFGTIKEGTQASHEFKFTNTGKDPLVLSSVHASCGCTTPTWPREPIAKSKSGNIKAVYNSTGRPGPFTKTITVQSNGTTPTKTLVIKGTVEAAPKAADGTPAREKSMMER